MPLDKLFDKLKEFYGLKNSYMLLITAEDNCALKNKQN